MKPDIHPKSEPCDVTCDCGATFTVLSTVPSYRVEICSNCHPFFTKKQKFVDTAGRIDRFKSRYGGAGLGEIGDKAKKANKAALSKPRG